MVPVDARKWPRNQPTATWVLVLRYIEERNPVTKSVLRGLLEKRVERGARE